MINLALLGAARAATLIYDWEVTWISAAPDGFVRPVIGINGMWPCPTIEANAGDNIIVKVVNGLVNETTSLHWHGISQKGSNEMDGADMVTQCPIPPGESFTYNFVVSISRHWSQSTSLEP